VTSVQSIDRAFSVLRSLAAGPAGVSKVAERVALPKSTVSRLLATLLELEAVEQLSPGGDYRLGPLVQEIGGAAAPGRALQRLARPFLVELTALTGEATGLSVLDGSDVLYLEQVDSDNPVHVRDWSGERVPAHVVSSGLVLLASAPSDVIDAYVERPLIGFTERSVTDPAVLATRLDEVRRSGVAWAYEEFEVGINSVAAAIRAADGTAVAAVHVHGPSYRFPANGAGGREAARVATVAGRISALLGAGELAAPTQQGDQS
jgi:DNA-binding IclR family transcriptional regulator